MATLSTHDAFAVTARTGIHEVARELNGQIGPTLVAALTGTPDRKLPIRWAKEGGPTPGPGYQRRLRIGHRVLQQVASVEGHQVARDWLVGANPILSEMSPIEAISADDFHTVVLAAQTFVSGGED